MDNATFAQIATITTSMITGCICTLLAVAVATWEGFRLAKIGQF